MSSLSSLVKFVLRLKGRGHTLSPKEVLFLKKLLARFEESFVKETLKRCFEEVIPPAERERSSILRCRKLFEKPQKASGVFFNPKTAGGDVYTLIRSLEDEKRKLLLEELKGFLRSKGGRTTREELEGFLKVVLRKYL